MKHLGWAALAAVLALSGCKSSKSKPPDQHVAPVVDDQPAARVEGASDLYGDPMPAGALARLGSTRMFDRALERMLFLPDGKQLVSNSADGYVIWDITDGSRAQHLEAEDAGPAMAVSPDGKSLATAHLGDGAVVIWDWRAGEATHRVAGDGSEITELCYLGNDKLVVGSELARIRVIDLAAGTDLAAATGEWAKVTAVACAADGKTAAAGTSDGAALVIDAAGAVTVLGKEGGRVNGVAISQDNRYYAFANQDSQIRIWNNGSPGTPRVIQAHDRLVYSVAFSAGGVLYSTGGDWWFRLWDPATGELREELEGIAGLDAQLFVLSPDSSLMASWSYHAGPRGSEAGRWWLWTARGRRVLEPKRHSGPLTSIAMSRDGKRIATAGEAGEIRLWDAISGQPLAVRRDEGGRVNAIEFVATGHQVHFAGAGARVAEWDPDANTLSVLVRAVGGEVNDFLLAEKSRRVFTGDQIGRVWSWDLGTKSKIQALDRGGYSAINGLALSADEKFLAIAGSDGPVRVVDLSTGQNAAELTSEELKTSYAVAFSPDGKVLASGGDDHAIYVWSTADWKLVKKLPGHDGTVRCLAFAPDSARLVSGGNDALVRVWDVGAGEQLAELAGHDSVITDVAVSRDGSRLVSASRDRTGYVWPMPSESASGEGADRDHQND